MCIRDSFKSIDLSLLSRLNAVAMDMNASFNRLFQKYCPKAPIVYDRYHICLLYTSDPKETGWRDASEETLPFVSCAFSFLSASSISGAMHSGMSLTRIRISSKRRRKRTGSYTHLIHGSILTAWGIAGVAGPLILAFMKETTGSYSATLQLFAGCLLYTSEPWRV